MMFHDILESNPSLRQQVTVEDEQLICSLIKGKDRGWMFEIISNSRNGIDVDKFDYLKRDSWKTNMKYNSFNHDKVMRGARVIDNQLCYPEKDIYEIKKLFDSRYTLFKECYHHRVT